MDAVRPASNRGGARLGSHEALERARYRDASYRVRLSVECVEYYRIGCRKATRRSCPPVQAAIPRCTDASDEPPAPSAFSRRRAGLAQPHGLPPVVLAG